MRQGQGLVAGESWLDRYLAFTQYQVSPRLFHLWSAIAVIGAALGRRVWLERGGYFYVYPGQIWVVLVSKSAITKKTTAGSLAVDFLKVLPDWQINILPKKLSPQQLLSSLERKDRDTKTPMKDPSGKRVDSTGFAWAGELGSFFTTEAFAEQLATHFNDLSDAPRGKVKIEFRSWKAELWNPCVGLLGGITPRGIAEELPKVARTAGFFGRILWVCQNTTDRFNSLTTAPPQLRDHRIWLEEELKSIANMEGPFRFSKRGRAAFDDWYYHDYVAQMQALDVANVEDTGYNGRKDGHLLRVAMVMSAAERRDRVIRQRHIDRALHALAEIEQNFPTAMAEIGTTNYSDYEKKMLETVELLGTLRADRWVSRERIAARMWKFGGGRRFQDAIDTLLGAGEIERMRDDEGEQQYRKKISIGDALRRAVEEGIVPRKERRLALLSHEDD